MDCAPGVECARLRVELRVELRLELRVELRAQLHGWKALPTESTTDARVASRCV